MLDQDSRTDTDEPVEDMELDGQQAAVPYVEEDKVDKILWHRPGSAGCAQLLDARSGVHICWQCD